MVLATLPYTTMSQISTVPIGIDQDNIRLCFVDVHDNSCFKEIVLIDMSSCTTCPAVAIATHVALVFLVFSFRLPLTYRAKITRTSMYPITIRSIMALDSAWMMLIGVRDGGQGGGAVCRQTFGQRVDIIRAKHNTCLNNTNLRYVTAVNVNTSATTPPHRIHSGKTRSAPPPPNGCWPIRL